MTTSPPVTCRGGEYRWRRPRGVPAWTALASLPPGQYLALCDGHNLPAPFFLGSLPDETGAHGPALGPFGIPGDFA